MTLLIPVMFLALDGIVYLAVWAYGKFLAEKKSWPTPDMDDWPNRFIGQMATFLLFFYVGVGRST